MSTRKSNTARRKTQAKPKLTIEEVRRIVHKLAAALEHNTEHISLMTMLFDQLESVSTNHIDIWSTVFEIKSALFVGTNASTDAQEQFQARAYANRGKLLLWPSERKGAA